MSANPYRTLGVDPNAEQVAIRSAYLALMRRYHPDQAGGGGDPRRAQEIGAAYEVLRDPGRRAAYDAGRVATVGPVAGAVAIPQARVRGGAIGRNAFIVLALATGGLAWWGLDRTAAPPPITAAPTPALREAKVAQAEVAVAPPAREEEAVKEVELPPPPVIREELASPVVVDPPLPMVAKDPPARPEQRPERRAVVERPVAARPVAESRAAARSVAPIPARPAAAAGAQAVDLSGLERHLRLLTDQSVRAGTSEERARIFATSGAFVARLNACASQACRRDAYLARNQEVAAIMR